MARGGKIPQEVHYTVIRLSSIMETDDIAFYTGISPQAVKRILRYFAMHGRVKGEREHETRGGVLRNTDSEFLFGAIRQTPDLYLDELKETLFTRCGQDVSISTIWRRLHDQGFTEKISGVAAERLKEKRLDYMARISFYEPRQLVFVDESSVDRRTTYRGHAWSIRGTKAQRKAFFVRGRRVSVLPAVSLEDGFLHCEVVSGSVRADTFASFIQDLLKNMQPFPQSNSVIVMDNCHIHKLPFIQEMIAARGVRCEFLPPSSPDFNPIELAFSWMKYNLRCRGDFNRLALTRMSSSEIYCCLLNALYSISLKDIHAEGLIYPFFDVLSDDVLSA